MSDKDKEKRANIVVCRCREITMGEIQDWIGKGYHTVNEIKRLTGATMGACQGRGCQDIIIREITKATGKSYREIEISTQRGPSKPVKMGRLV